MPLRHLLPIPIAHGRSGNTGYLSVYFEPRLYESMLLTNYSDWKVWPNVVNALTYTVRVNGAIRPAVRVSPNASLAKWQAAFGGQTPIEAFRPIDRRFTPVTTYGQSALNTTIGVLYGGVMLANPTAPPTAAALMANPVTEAFLTGATGQLPEAMDFVAPVIDPADPVEAPVIDFHAAYRLLSSHPELMRLLGMVVDLEVTLPAGVPNNVRVNTDYETLAGYGNTRVEIPFRLATTDQFWPKANTNALFKEQTAGWTDLGDGGWGLTAVNDLVASSRLTTLGTTIESGETGGALPAQEESGIQLLRTDNAAAVRNQWIRQKQIEDAIADVDVGNASFVEVFGEDVTIGQRIDVRDEANNIWRSLFQRQGDEYAFPRDAAQDVVPDPDEGWTTFVLASEQKETYITPHEGFRIPTARHRIRDTFFTWNGWSAAAPPPSNVIDADGNVVPIEASESPADAKVRMNVRYSVVPGTLPRLRYSHTYEMRARAVFIDGSSRALAETELAESVTPPHLYGRQLPVAAPEIVRRVDKPVPGVGEFVDTVVLLGDYDLPNLAVAKHERILFPPRAPQARCELHDLPNGGVDPAIANHTNLAQRDAESVATQCVTDPISGDLVANPTYGVTPLARYLAEPPAANAAFIGLPGAASTVVVPWDGAWPTKRGARLIVEAGTTAPTVSGTGTGRTIRVRLPKAADLTVDVSSGLVPSFLDHFALWNVMNSTTQAARLADAQNGRLWMMSPARQLRLIHAVRRPMLAPAIVSLAGTRPEIGSDRFVFDTTITMDRASTDQLRLRASFTDPTDDPSEAAPGTQDRSLVLGTFSVDPTGAATSFTADDHEAVLYDQKHHEMIVDVEAHSRFARYFTEQLDTAFTTDTIVLNPAGVLAHSVVVTDAATGVEHGVDSDYSLDREAGSVTRLAGGAIAAGGAVRIRFIARPISRISTEGGAPTFAVSVPSSRRPDPIEVREVVPATAVSDSSGAGYVERVRTGTVVRVWSERGWYSSGVGEVLGVLIDPSAGVPDYTRLGRDPLTAGDASPNPALGDFPRAVATVANVDGIDVAAHDIGFDAARGLWYSDIQIAGAVDYRPFLRLSLARYQPLALAGTSLSRVVHMDPIRLMPNRTSRVTKNANGTYTVRVEGIEHEGVPNEAAGNALRFNTVKVEFQVPNPTIADADLRWQKVGSVFTLTRTKLGTGITSWESTVTAPGGLGTAARVAITETEPNVERDGETGVKASGNEVAIETLDIATLL